MFSALAGMYMSAKLHCAQIKTNVTKRQDQQISEMVYKNKIDKKDEKDRYKKSTLPESGYMTLEEYEVKARGLTRKEINEKNLDKPDIPKDKRYVYVPQHKFKLVKYNDPVGSPELSLPRRLQFDRQINAQGIISGDYTKLVYPAVYYYAEPDCVSSDLFLINLDPALSNMEKIEKANILNKDPKPLLSTSKDIDTKFVFRTLTPIDFSSDNSKLVVKEKIGYKHDGIWKTDLWVYDFNTKSGKNLTALREAIIYYWQKKQEADLSNNRWDIYPLGFDANNDDRILVSAYAYTGSEPKFLGTWSIDVNNTSARLEDLTGASMPVAIVGYRLAEQHEVKSISELEFEAKQAKKAVKEKGKTVKAERKQEKQKELVEYRRKIHQMDMETMLKVRERQKWLKENKKKHKDGVTDNLGEELKTDEEKTAEENKE